MAMEVKELSGFERIALAPGETKKVTFPLGPEAFAFWNDQNKFAAEPARVTLWVGPDSSHGSEATLQSRNRQKDPQMNGERSLSRREVMRICGIGLLSSPLATLAGCEKPAARPFAEPAGAPYDGTDQQLPSEIQRATFHFCWDEASQKTGEAKDAA